jgi:branched-chain amino acid aminotransferase
MKKLIQLEKGNIPKGEDCFLYVRPTYISMTDQLGVLPATGAKLFIIMSSIKMTKKNPLKILCQDNIIKKYPNSFGHLNLGSNLGPILEQLKIAKEKNYDDILFLFNENITELSDMNLFVYWENPNGIRELVTPALDGTVLPGITRDSVIHLVKEMKINVIERHISIKEIINAFNEDRHVELFGTSTENGITQIGEIKYENKAYKLAAELNLNNKTEFTQSLHDKLSKIISESEGHPWITVVD